MSEDAEIHAWRLKRSTDRRSEGDPLGGANEGQFASIPAVGSVRFALILGVIAVILLAIIVSCVAARKPETDAHGASVERAVCLMARLQNGPRAQDPTGDPCTR